MMNIWSCEKCLRAWNRCICEKPERVSDSSQVAGSAKFSIDEIEKWLEGWMLFDGKGDESKPRNMALSLALSLLRDEEDGIETYTKHNATKQASERSE